jgi:hypothetical protein
MIDIDSLKQIRFVVDPKGRKSAVQVDLNTWAALMQYLEDLEDRVLIKEKLARLSVHPENSGAIPWEETRGEW